MTDFERINLYLIAAKKHTGRATSDFPIKQEQDDTKNIISSYFYVLQALKRLYETFPDLKSDMASEFDGSEEGRIRFENLGWLAGEAARLECGKKFDKAIKLYDELLSKAGDKDGKGYFEICAQAGLYRCNAPSENDAKEPKAAPLETAKFHTTEALKYLRETVDILQAMQKQKTQTEICNEMVKEAASAAFFAVEAWYQIDASADCKRLDDQTKESYDKFFDMLKQACELENSGEKAQASKIYDQILKECEIDYFFLRAQAGAYRCNLD